AGAVSGSPPATSASAWRSSGACATARASPSRRFVSPAMAETTTTTPWPAARVRAIRPATLRIRSTSATDVPPYFWTTTMRVLRDLDAVGQTAGPRSARLAESVLVSGAREEPVEPLDGRQSLAVEH